MLIDGVDICAIGLRDLRSNIAIIPQAPFVYSDCLDSLVASLATHSQRVSVCDTGSCALLGHHPLESGPLLALFRLPAADRYPLISCCCSLLARCLVSRVWVSRASVVHVASCLCDVRRYHVNRLCSLTALIRMLAVPHLSGALAPVPLLFLFSAQRSTACICANSSTGSPRGSARRSPKVRALLALSFAWPSPLPFVLPEPCSGSLFRCGLRAPFLAP